MRCLVCASEFLEPLTWLYSTYCPGLFRRIAICRECGHVQVQPLFTWAEYEAVNERDFSHRYLPDGIAHTSDNAGKLAKIDLALAGRVRPGMKVLDVGAGEAWAMEYFRARGCSYHALEAVARLTSSIEQRGGKVIGRSLFEGLPEWHGAFDLVVFRHVLEHLLDPRDALERLRRLLSPGGLLYVALPNGGAPSIRKGFRTSFLRPVHVSYFCPGNVRRLASTAGLETVWMSEHPEIACIFRDGSVRDGHADVEGENFYEGQRALYRQLARDALFIDAKNIVRSIPRAAGQTLSRRRRLAPGAA